MATATRDRGKTSFVKEFLNRHPQGNVQAVNEAWAAAGNDGSIGATLIQKMRSKMGLSGNLRATSKPKTAAKRKSAAKKSKMATVTPGKTMFVKEFLNDHPQGNFDDVNEAWTAAGFEGTISRTLVDKMRALLGLTGNQRSKSKKVRTSARGNSTSDGKKPGRPRKEPMAAINGQPRGRKSNRSLALTELEGDIDRLIFKVMGVGDLTEIEDSLRRARRLLYAIANGR